MGFALAGATVLGSVIQSNASRSAAATQAASAADANANQLYMYQQQRADQEPWRQSGGRALDSLEKNNFMDNWQQNDPGYQFRLDEGNKAINAASAARGNFNSGATMKALTKYGQDYSSNEYNNAYNRQYNRLSSLAGFGQNANAANSASGNSYATNYGNNVMGAANAQSAGQMAQANNMSNLLNTGASTYMQYQMMNRMFPNAS